MMVRSLRIYEVDDSFCQEVARGSLASKNWYTWDKFRSLCWGASLSKCKYVRTERPHTHRTTDKPWSRRTKKISGRISPVFSAASGNWYMSKQLNLPDGVLWFLAIRDLPTEIMGLFAYRRVILAFRQGNRINIRVAGGREEQDLREQKEKVMLEERRLQSSIRTSK